MSLEADIARWIGTRPTWQQQIFSSLCKGDPIGEAAIDQIAEDLLTGSDAVADALQLSASDIPGGAAISDPVRLLQLRNVEGINALASGQTLTFSGSGLTVIYGDNGSGKSGYGWVPR
ncbi:ATP-binding protein [Pseudarthrobacter sp. PH31-O2]|uniref:ATP-binding protein n=1 Tax=Pseudarthrobacter sp. PH31-O2 TaxID=3046206 RepID=UPI0024B99151|nr:ATP-binding protein [Pseudarthrobacter sp. PH31-O2]MDJ0354395.1 ATP-binding protein [Pseudarthrobacter sp. PH31-O2]